MEGWKHSVVLVGFALAFLACDLTPQKEKDKPVSWSGQMQDMASEVRALIPYLYNRKAFVKADNRDEVKTHLTRLKNSIHKFSPDMGKKYLGEDPLIQHTLGQLEADVERSVAAFEAGQLEYSREVTKGVLNHCFRCHTTDRMKAKVKWDVDHWQGLELRPGEKLDLLVASRQFGEVSQVVEDLLKDSEYIQRYPFEFEDTFRKYMAVMVRIEKKPEQLLAQVEQVLEHESLPFYLREQAESWRKSLRAWVREGKTPATAAGLKSAAKKRLQRARKLQEFARDHAGDVEYLRASQLLHGLLKKRLKAPGKAEAYYQLGQVYEVLDELGYWNLHETYYTACIRTAPQTPTARSCFGQLQESIYRGYTGSAGTQVPSAEKQRLQELKSLIQR